MEFVVLFASILYYGLIYYNAVMNFSEQRRIDRLHRLAVANGLSGLTFYRARGKPISKKSRNINWKKEGF